MILLDTDHISLLERGSGAEAQRLTSRLSRLPPSEVAACIVSLEEQTRGWLAYLAKARSLEAGVEAYRRLRQHLLNYCAIPLLDFDEHAAAGFNRLRKVRLRMGTMDLKIAAIAVANEATLLSRNVSDFRLVPNLDVQDWTR
jgi:tRNA(fMet)-specific endonuclease VapC